MGEASQLIPWKTLHQRHCNIGLLLRGCVTSLFTPCQPPSNSPSSSTTSHTALLPHNHASRPIIVTHLQLQSHPTSKALAPSSALLCVERRRLSRGLRVLPNKVLQLCPNITGSLAKKEVVCDVTNVSIHKFRKRFIGSLECPACARMHDGSTHGASRARSSFQLASPPGESLTAPSRFTTGQITVHT
ncbi:trans-sialidase [Trypanosoma cruzi]|nr:trans-sialidase [Trypanosoma cruzi]